MRTQSEWNVEISGFAGSRLPSSLPARSCISPAALLVNVTARIRSGRRALADQLGDAIGDDPRFARAGAGQDQQRPVKRLHRLALGRIQVVRHAAVGPGARI